MALPESTISRACRAVADYLNKVFVARSYGVTVLIGAPAAVTSQASNAHHRLNLFFHRFEPAGFGPDTSPGETAWIRAHCVMTAFGIDEMKISAGENDLRILGEVLRIFHEKPVMDPVDVGGEMVKAQMIFVPLQLDDINRLWSTQKDVAYRPSLAYEVALLPVAPLRRDKGSPRVGTLEISARGGSDDSTEERAPQIAFLHRGTLVEGLVLKLGSAELGALVPAVVISGTVGSKVTLRWEIWDKVEGWRAGGTSKEVAVTRPRIDSEAVPLAGDTSIDLPFTKTSGQAMLYAVRSETPPDGVPREVRSNPLLVTIHGGTA